MEGAGASNNSAVLPIGVIKREFDEGAQFYGNSNDYHKPWKNNWVKRGYNAYAGRGRNASGERGRGRSEYRPQNFNNDGTSAEDGRPDDQENKKDRL